MQQKQCWQVYTSAQKGQMISHVTLLECSKRPKVMVDWLTWRSPPLNLSSTGIKAEEMTSSSFSNLDFSHYKAAAQDPTLAYMYTKMCNLSHAQGQPLRCWKSGLTVMLEKEPGNLNVEKL